MAPYADDLIRIPPTPTLLQPPVATVSLQVFASKMAMAKGHDVDQPRNLAKSVSRSRRCRGWPTHGCGTAGSLTTVSTTTPPFLRASRAPHDPHLRHHRAAIGHAKSADLRTWELLADALVHSDAPAWDDLATWTGSVIQDPAGCGGCSTPGSAMLSAGRVQRIGVAVSDDLHTWVRDHESPILEADGRWYE